MRIAVMVIMAVILASSVYAGVMIVTDSSAVGYNNAAYFVYQDGDLEGAAELYRRAIAEDATYQAARYNLATLLFEKKEYNEAATELKALVEMDGLNVNYKYDLAVNLVEDMRLHNTWDDFHYALSLYREVEAQEPGFEYAAENIAVMEQISS